MADKKPKVKITQEDGNEVAPEIIATAIQDIADAMKVFDKSRLSQEAIIILIHHQSKIPQRDIRIVLNNLKDLAKDWLK